MAKRGKSKTKAKPEPEVEEDTDLEDLEDLDDLDELDEEEPEEDAEEEEDEDEDEEDEDSDDDEDEDEEDDDEEDLESLSIKVLRDRAKGAGMKAAKAKELKGSAGKKKLAKYILANEDLDEEDDEDEEEEETPKAKSKSKGKKKGGSRKGQAPPTRELPKGRLGAQDVADAAGVDARAVRVFLRKHKDEFPKDEELGRYSFTKKDVAKIAKKIKADKKAKADDDE